MQKGAAPVQNRKNKRRVTKLLCCLLAAAAALTLSACVKEAESPSDPGSEAPEIHIEEPGGTVDNTDPDAPKEIASSEIESFRCALSLRSLDREGQGRALLPYYELTARRTETGVSCTRNGSEFTAEPGFLERLQEIVERYDLAQYNGIDRETHGLPEFFGSMIHVEYASGEKIFASDNTLAFLPDDAALDLVTLFGGVPTYTAIGPGEAAALMETEENALILDVRTPEEFASGHIPGALCLPNEEIQSLDTGELFERDRLLLVYCRSGRRSKEAAKKLAADGYTRVYEFGGILDWPGEIVTEE